MFKQTHIPFLVCASMTLGGLAGCDGADDAQPDASLEASEVADPIDVVMFPAAPAGGSRAGVEASHASELAAAGSDSIPIADENRYAPSDELMIDWLRWALIQPYATGSISDPTGEQCGLGQDGPVWYLAGTFGGPVERDCTIPAGKQLFLPLINSWCVFPSEFYSSDEEIAADIPYVADWFDQNFGSMCTLTLRIDGEDLIPDMATLEDALYVEVLDPFEVELDEAHWASQYFDGGVMPAIGAGYYAHVQPLTPGEHTLELGGTICGEGGFSTSATYHLTIED